MSRWNTPQFLTSASCISPSAVSNMGRSTGRMPDASKSSGLMRPMMAKTRGSAASWTTPPRSSDTTGGRT
jgi:hypothetical protein